MSSIYDRILLHLQGIRERFPLNSGKSQGDQGIHISQNSDFTNHGEPPEIDDAGLVATPLKMPRDLRKELDLWAKRRGLSRSAAINLLIAKGVRGLD